MQVHSNEVDRLTFSKDLRVLTSKSVPELLNEELDLLVGSDHTNIVDESENKESPLLVIEYTLLVVTLNQIETDRFGVLSEPSKESKFE